MNDPFLGSEAVANGILRKHQLRSQYRTVFPDVYIPRDQQPTVRQLAVAGWLWSHRNGVLAGVIAAAWHGSKWVDQHLPVELIWSNARPPRGLRTYDMTLCPDELDWVGGLPVTTPGRTAFDIGCRKPMGPAIAHLDALVRATGLRVDEVREIAARHPGVRGLRKLEAALEWVDAGSQSPKESWLRLLLVKAGLPRPTTQIPVDAGNQMYYLDMGWPDLMVAVEYDGEHHRLDRWQYTKDIRRSEELARLGWIVIRVVASDRPEDILRRVRDALAHRNCAQIAIRRKVKR
jgi:very-short-patch-repair endonuclease